MKRALGFLIITAVFGVIALYILRAQRRLIVVEVEVIKVDRERDSEDTEHIIPEYKIISKSNQKFTRRKVALLPPTKVGRKGFLFFDKKYNNFYFGSYYWFMRVWAFLSLIWCILLGPFFFLDSFAHIFIYIFRWIKFYTSVWILAIPAIIN